MEHTANRPIKVLSVQSWADTCLAKTFRQRMLHSGTWSFKRIEGFVVKPAINTLVSASNKPCSALQHQQGLPLSLRG